MRILPLAIAFTAALASAADEQPVKLTFKPQSVELEQSLQFDDSGRAQRSESNLTLQFNVFSAPAAITVVGYGNPRFTEILTDRGEKLIPSDDNSGWNRIDPRMRQYQAQGPAFSIYTHLAAPRQPATKLTVMTGTIDIHLATGKPKSAEIKPLKDFFGKRLQIDGIEGAEVTVLDKGEDGIELIMPKATEEKLADVAFSDAAGGACEINGWGGGGSGSTIERTYQVKVPADGALVLQFHHNLRKVTVPFTITDLPLPGGEETAKPVDAVIKTKDAEPDAPQGELKVKAEGGF